MSSHLGLVDESQYPIKQQIKVYPTGQCSDIPWVPEIFLAAGTDLTKTGNRAGKVSGTQGSVDIAPKEVAKNVKVAMTIPR